MWGTRDLHYYQLDQIKRVRIVRRADGYFVQVCLDQERIEKREPTGKTIGLDVGLTVRIVLSKWAKYPRTAQG